LGDWSVRLVYPSAEIITGWQPLQNGVWTVTIPNSFFNDYNPYKDLINGDWFYDQGRDHHTGEVYLNGTSLFEKATLTEVMQPQPFEKAADKEASTWTWYCESDDDSTTLWANFHAADPNTELVEINVRESCFYPDAPGRNYITVRGFHLRQAATQWAAPTAEQIGLLGVHWSKGWIIENNIISDSKCVGITLGKDRKTGHNVWSKDKSKGGDIHYNEVVRRALKNGWSKETIGSHIVRNNTIYNCEAAGICGSMGAIFSRVTDNHIYNIEVKRQFTGAETAGIKFHAAIDALIANNRIHHASKGMWLDWMTQGARVTSNLFYDNYECDLFIEMNHGPYLIDNNIFLSDVAVWDWAQGCAFVHNLFAGEIVTMKKDHRRTPYHKPHSTEIAGMSNIVGGDNRFYNNIFAGGGLAAYDDSVNVVYPLQLAGNVYFAGASPCSQDTNAVQLPEFDA
jgi:hypothetical protein